MSKFIALAVLTTLTLLPNTFDLQKRSVKSPPPDEMNVQIRFSGLMVFHLNNETKSYEVGILSEQDSPEHYFCIEQIGAYKPRCREKLPKTTRWTLTVDVPPGGNPHNNGHNGVRRPDHEPGQYDFDWIVDLEGKEFHNEALPLQKGHLVPIIQLPKATLFTLYKSEDFTRWQGKKPDKPTPFGFVSETIAMNLKIKKGERVVLKETDSGDEIMDIKYAAPTPGGPSGEVLKIVNIRPGEHQKSDFRMYYNLFKGPPGSGIGVPEDKQFDFDMNEEENPPRPFNPVPKYRTCCNLMCTEILLSKWSDPLH